MTIEHAHAGEANCTCTADARRVPWWEDDELMRRLNEREAQEWVQRRRSIRRIKGDE
jgi:hypothetical protein